MAQNYNTDENEGELFLQNDSQFWNIFSEDVRIFAYWSCSDLDVEIVSKANSEDEQLFESLPNSISQRIKRRRSEGIKIKNRQDIGEWSEIVFKACRDISDGKNGHQSPEIKYFEEEELMNPLKDFVIHLHYFQIVSKLMSAGGHGVVSSGQKMSLIHDIDKLDPIMLIAYAEKFQDGQDTSLWRKCVERHLAINVHHQQHSIWRREEEEKREDAESEKKKWTAALEMACDKAARKLQKDLKGLISKEIWIVDSSWFGNLPTLWIDRIQKVYDEIKSKSS